MKKKLVSILLVATMVATMVVGCGSSDSSSDTSSSTATTDDSATEEAAVEEVAELEGDIVFWHSFTQGDRLDIIQETADRFMEENPGVTITIETFSWGDFYTKWTTGLASGNVPDMSTALPGHVVEMMDAEALYPLNDLIDDIGRDTLSEAALSEGEADGVNYSIPLYSHAQVMWYRTDLLEAAGLEVPTTWEEFAYAAEVLTGDGIYGCSVPTGSSDLMGTRFLNFYVRSAGGSL
ncbi:MAG: extracellular solute-binding protein, partial [Eubacteriales bacterium]